MPSRRSESLGTDEDAAVAWARCKESIRETLKSPRVMLDAAKRQHERLGNVPLAGIHMA
jgi:hypothetical protein